MIIIIQNPAYKSVLKKDGKNIREKNHVSFEKMSILKENWAGNNWK